MASVECRLLRVEGRVQGVEMINHPSSVRPGVNAMLNEAYRVQFAPAIERAQQLPPDADQLVSAVVQDR